MDLTLSLTHNCNLGCTYCYAGLKYRRAMTWEVAEKAIDFAFNLTGNEMQLGFFGGEPLMEWDLLQKSTERVEAKAAAENVTLKKTVTTNGTLLTPERVAWLADHDFFPAISIDGNRAMHDITRQRATGGSSFDPCMRGLGLALARFPDLEVIMVPDPSNVKHMADGVRFLADEAGVRRVAINPNFYTDWSAGQLDAFGQGLEEIGQFYLERYRNDRPLAINFIDGKIITRLKEGFEACDRCSFGEGEMAVAPSGNLYPCARLVGEDTNQDICLGSVQNGFDNEKRARILAGRGNTNTECETCAVQSRCMNWCGCINYATTGMTNRTSGLLCFHERKTIEVADHVATHLFAEHNPPFLTRFYYEDFQFPIEETAPVATGPFPV